jgi:hypothetical protein
MPTITDEIFFNDKNDESLKKGFEERCKKLQVDEALVKKIKTGGRGIAEARSHAQNVYDTELSDEDHDISGLRASAFQRKESAKVELEKWQRALDGLEANGKHIERTGARVSIPKSEKVSMVLAGIGGIVLYLAGLGTSVSFLYYDLGWDIWRALIFPVPGVTGLVFMLKYGLSYLPIKWSGPAAAVVCVIGLAAVGAWVFTFGEFIGNRAERQLEFIQYQEDETTGQPAIADTAAVGPDSTGNADGTGAAGKAATTIKLTILAIFAEAFASAFLFQWMVMTTRKHTYHDAVVDTEEYKRAKSDRDEAKKQFELYDSRIRLADSITKQLTETKERLLNDAETIYNLP